MKRAALALLLLAAAPAAAALPSKLPPVDQCKGDAGFTRFRGALMQAVAKKDRGALLALMAPDVMVDFGGSSGPAEFAKQWSFDRGEYGNVWQQLGTMLKLGCANSDGVRVIPSLSIQLDKFDADEVFELRLVLPGAKLFKEPGKASTAAAIPAWSIATATNTSGDLWTGAKLANGRKGFISDDLLYEPLGYRMTVEQRAGKWMITAFVAGD